MAIFRENAQKYWDEGVPVIPLKRNDKMPWIVGWQKFALTMPTLEEQETWLRMYGEGNIGLPLGPAAGIDGVDVDSIDQKVLGLLEKMLPKTYWKRVGAKGYMLAYRHNPKLRSFNLKQKDGGMIIEMLSKGRQMVLPPSQHPTTGRPYTANAELLDVKSILPELPSDIEIILRGALKDIGIEVGASGSTKTLDFVPAGARDTEMCHQAGIFAHVVRRGENTLLEVLGMMDQWVRNYTAKVAGDDLDPAKARAKVVEFLIRTMSNGRYSIPVGWDAGLTAEQKEDLGINFGMDLERWDADKIYSYLTEEFNRYSDTNSVGFRNAVQVALGKIAKNPDGVKALGEAKILNFIATAGGKNFGTTVVKKELADLKKGDLVGDNHVEIAEAMLKELQQEGEIRFDLERFHRWGGGQWKEMDEVTEIIVPIQNTYGKLPAARRHNDHMAIKKTISDQTKKPLALIDRPMINFANGVLDDDRVIHPHDPNYGHRYVLNYRYLENEAGKCPMFFDFLHDCWGDDPDFQEKVLALQEMMAVTMFGVAAKYQRAFCLKGLAHTGKTRIIELMRGLMPEKCSSNVPPSEWGDKFAPANMAGKLMNVCGEISEKNWIDGDKFKQIVDGVEIKAQHKYGQEFDFQPRCAQWFAGNHLPKTKDTSGGFNRRWLFLEFNKVVPDEEKVVDIDKVILAAEREQIAAWAVQAIGRIKETGQYTFPISHEVLINQMAAENNSVHYFLADCPRLRIGREAHHGRSETRTSETQLHHEYSLFCIGMGLARPVMPRRFHSMMQDLAKVFGFNQQVRMTDRNGMLVEYEWITLAANAKAAA